MTKYLFDDLVRNCKEKVDRDNNPYEYFVAGDHMESERPKLTMRGRFDEADVGPAFNRLFRPGQVLYGSRRTYLRKVSVVDFEGVTSNVTFVLETKDESILPQRLLPFLLLSDRFTNYSIGKSKGSTNPYVLFSDLADFEIDLPEPETVTEIADIMCVAEQLKENYRSLLATCDDVVKSQFVEMFSDVGHTNPLEKLIIPNTRISYGIVQPGPGGTGDMGVLRPVDIVDGYLCLDGVKRIDEKIGYPYRRTELKGTEVLTVVRGATGQTVRSNASCIGMNVTRGIAVIRYDSRLIDPDYLVGYMNSDDGQRYIADHTKGATLQQINISDLKVMPIPVPSIKRQQQFAAFVAQVDKSKFAVQKALDELNATTKKIMNQELGLGDV